MPPDRCHGSWLSSHSLSSSWVLNNHNNQDRIELKNTTLKTKTFFRT
jgi:hypothetical protein